MLFQGVLIFVNTRPSAYICGHAVHDILCRFEMFSLKRTKENFLENTLEQCLNSFYEIIFPSFWPLIILSLWYHPAYGKFYADYEYWFSYSIVFLYNFRKIMRLKTPYFVSEHHHVRVLFLVSHQKFNSADDTLIK